MPGQTHSVPDLLGEGLYTPADVSRLLVIPVSTVRRWLSGYSYRLVSTREVRWSGPVVGHSEERVVTFLDLVELLMVKGFRSAGVSLPNIRIAALTATELLKAQHPLAFQMLETDGRHIFAHVAETSDIEGLVNLSKRGQIVFPRMVEQYLRELDYEVDSQYAVRWWPRGKTKPIVVDPMVSFGAPHIAGTGVPTLALYQAAAAGDTPDEVARWFRVGVEQVEEAVTYERELQAA